MADSEAQWLYVVGDQRVGPVTAQEIGMLISSGQLAGDTLVWEPGMAGWEAANTLPQIITFLAPPVPDRLSPEVKKVNERSIANSVRTGQNKDRVSARRIVDESDTFLGGAHHPWRRYFARLIDASVLGLPAFLLMALGLPADWIAKVPRNPAFLGSIIMMVAIPVEALLISFWGTTPGKWLFGITVRKADGSNLDIPQAVGRTARAVAQGAGLGVPVLSMVPLYLAYRRLTKTGNTLWDAASGSRVLHTTWGHVRGAAVVLTMIVWAFGMMVFADRGRARPSARSVQTVTPNTTSAAETASQPLPPADSLSRQDAEAVAKFARLCADWNRWMEPWDQLLARGRSGMIGSEPLFPSWWDSETFVSQLKRIAFKMQLIRIATPMDDVQIREAIVALASGYEVSAEDFERGFKEARGIATGRSPYDALKNDAPDQRSVRAQEANSARPALIATLLTALKPHERSERLAQYLRAEGLAIEDLSTLF